MNGQTSETATLLDGIDPSVVPEIPRSAGVEILSAKPRDVISTSDEAALIGFFANTTFERSTFGAIVEHLMYTAMGSHACARCDGEGVLNDGGFRMDDKCRRCNGNGFLSDGVGDTPTARYLTAETCPQCRGTRKEPPYEVQLKHGGWCPSCKGTGASGIDRRGGKPKPCGLCPGKTVALVRAGVADGKPAPKPKTRACKNCGVCKACRDARACRDCRNCLGTGVEPVSVHQTGQEGATGREGADEAALTKFALVSRRLERVRAKSPALFRALARYYGESGERWGLTDRGRIFALYEDTTAGRGIVSRARRASAKPWVNPRPAFGVQTTDEPTREDEEMWERAAKNSRRCSSCCGRGSFVSFNFKPGVHRAPCNACAGDGHVMPAERGWLPTAPATEHDIPVPEKHRSRAELIALEGDDERKRSNPERKQLLSEAGKQARAMYARAAAAWNESRVRSARGLIDRANELGMPALANHLASQAGAK